MIFRLSFLLISASFLLSMETIDSTLSMLGMEKEIQSRKYESLEENLENFKMCLDGCFALLQHEYIDLDAHLDVYREAYEKMKEIRKLHYIMLDAAQTYNFVFETFSRSCSEFPESLDYNAGKNAAGTLTTLNGVFETWMGMNTAFPDLLAAFEVSSRTAKIQEELQMAIFQRLLSNATKLDLGEVLDDFSEILKDAKTLHTLHTNLLEIFLWLSRLVQGPEGYLAKRQADLEEFKLFMLTAKESFDRFFYINQYASLESENNLCQGLKNMSDVESTTRSDKSQNPEMYDLTEEAWCDQLRENLQFARYHNFNRLHLRPAAINIQYSHQDPTEIALDLAEIWPEIIVLFVNPYCPCSELDLDAAPKSLVTMFSAPPTLYPQSAYVDQHVENHNTDGSLVMSLRGIREARRVITLQFEFALELGCQIMVVGEFGCEKCRLPVSQVLEIYREGTKLFAGKSLKRVIFCRNP